MQAHSRLCSENGKKNNNKRGHSFVPLSRLTLTNGASVFLALYRPLVRLLLLLPSLLWHLPLLLAPR